jgi:hypothetical protein
MLQRAPIPVGTTVNRRPAELAANSLFRKILRVSPCGSIFWADQPRSAPHNSFKTKILQIAKKKIVDIPTPGLTPHSTLPRLPEYELARIIHGLAAKQV